MKNKSIDMINGKLFGSVIMFSLPIIATGILQILYNNADLIVVGQFAPNSDNAVGAIGSTTSLIHLIVNLFLGLSVGANVALAQSLGRNDDAESEKTVHTSMLFSLICGIVLMIIGVLFSRTFLTWMNATEALIDQSTVYLRIYFLGMPASMVYNFGSAILRAKGDTKRPLLYLMISGAINVVLNCVFVILFRMDVDGVAWSTIISQYISAILILIALFSEQGCCRLTLSKLKLHPNETVLILRYGIPAGLTSIMFNISNVFIQTALNGYQNEAIVNGSAAASSLEGIVYTSMNAFSQAAMTFAGQNIGAGNYKRIGKIYAMCAAISVSVGIILGYGIYFFAEPMLKIFIKNPTEDTIKYGIMRMSCILLFYFLDGLMEVQMGITRAMGYSSVPTIITIITVCIFRLVWLVTVFKYFGTLISLFLCYPITWALSVIIMHIVYMILYNRDIKPKIKAQLSQNICE